MSDKPLLSSPARIASDRPGDFRLSAGRRPWLQLAVNQITTYRWNLLQDVTGYRERGIPAIGLWRPKLAEFGEERGIELVRDSGLHVSSLSWAGGFTGSHGHSYVEALDDARDAVCVAGALGAGCLVVFSGARNSHTVNHAKRCLVDALNALGPLAEEHGVRLALQPMHPMFAQEWTFLTDLDSALDVLDRCNHDWGRLAFDVYHLWQQPRLLERIPALAPRTALVQLSDWREPPRSDLDRCLPGEGEIPLSDIVRTFDSSGYDGFYELGIWSEEVWRSKYEWLVRECRTRYGALWAGSADAEERN